MKNLLPICLVALAGACNDGGPVAEGNHEMPPLDRIEAPTADWSALSPAIGQTPAESGMLTKGPIVTDVHALVGEDAIRYRGILERAGGPLTRVGNLLVTVTPPGGEAAYLLVDPRLLALEAGYRKEGRWIVRRTPAAEIVRPASIEALVEG